MVYITPTLLSAVNSQLCSSFSSSSSPFPLYFYACHVTFACAFNPNLPHVFSILSSPPYLHFFFYLPPPFSALHFLSPFLPPLVSPAIWQPSSRSPLRIFTRAVLPTIRTHYCQLCHLRPPERQKKRRGGGGTVPVEMGLMCMWWGGRVLYSILDTTTKHSV